MSPPAQEQRVEGTF